MEFEYLDEDKAFDLVFGDSNIKYHQDNKYFNSKGIRVDVSTGKVMEPEEIEHQEEIIEQLELTETNPTLKKVEREIKEGLSLPKRMKK